MTTIQIELPDEQAIALKACAAAQGLTLEEWIQNLARQQYPKHKYRLQDLLDQCDPQAPLSEEDREWIDAPPIGREAL